MKESNPVEVSKFVVARGFSDELAFSWWVPFTLKKRNRIIAAVNLRVSNKTHKFGIEVPMSIDNAKRFDSKNRNTLWQDVISKEIYQVW